MSAAEKRLDKKAGLDDFAALRFEGNPEAVAGLGTAAEWSERTRAHYSPILLALTLLKDDQDGIANIVSAEPEAFMELHRCVENVRTYYEALAGLLNTASLRIMAGLSRYATETEQEGEL